MVMKSKKRVSVLVERLFLYVGLNILNAKCIYDLSLKIFTVANSKQTQNRLRTAVKTTNKTLLSVLQTT